MKIVIVGAGQVGYHIAGHLAVENKNVVVIDTDPAALRRVSETLDVQTFQGTGSSPQILEEAGLKSADILLAVTDSDETNLVACLVADILSPTTLKLARIRNPDFEAYHGHFHDHAPHIDKLINPEVEVVRNIERLMSVPGAVDVGEFAAGRVKFVGLALEADSPLCGHRLMDLARAIGRPVPLIAAIVRGEQLIIPRGPDRIEPGDRVYFISEDADLTANLKIFQRSAEPVRRVLIVGAGRTGFRLATRLEARSIYTKVIERDHERCRTLAERLDKTVVLHGDGSDRDLLAEENVADIDVVIPLTDDEETNILVSLLAKRMGARQTITRISKFSYFPLMATIGLDQVVSLRLSAINSILQYIRRGKVLSAIRIKGEQGEVLEVEALETADIVGRPLMDVTFPQGALVTGIIRGETVIIPSGTSVILPGDHVIIFARREAIPRIEKILAVKLEYF